MQIELKTWYTLSSLRTFPDGLILRFLPDHFFVEDEPVLVVTVDHPFNANIALQQLDRFRVEECVVEISVESGAVDLWAEYDEEPTRLSGEKTSYEWSNYSVEEALNIARVLENQLSMAQSENVALHAGKRELNEFVDELVHRAKIKRSLSRASTTVADGQIDVLSQVLNKIAGV